ncbi:MAG: aminoglycoside phosphotransferase family protein [Phycisphaerae bacterium]|nr:aminoglycoside phosphotransferase family protein [Phycisphaerae bacterium]
MDKYVEEVFRHFSQHGQLVQAKPFGSGHINDTFLVKAGLDGQITKYVLQRINHDVFTDPLALMVNYIRVTGHIREKLQDRGDTDIFRKVLTVLKSDEGESLHIDTDGNYWRLVLHIDHSLTVDVVENLDQAYESAKEFGNFQAMLVDLPGGPLHDTIPDFHNGPKRYQAFLEALRADIAGRADSAKAEIEFLQSHAYIFDVLPKLVAQGKIPVRITHNDTKINNVLLDADTGKGLCAIDLDTVMPGLSLYDFGDIIRTATSSAAEDEQDLSKVNMEMDRFDAVLRGFLDGAGGFLNDTEIDNLVLGGKMITLMIGTRFLTDYLTGDKYFKVHRLGHNLDRCRTQFKLVESIEAQEKKMQELVIKYARKNMTA